MTQSARAAALRSTAHGDKPGAGRGIIGIGGGRLRPKPKKFRCRSRGRSRATSCPRPTPAAKTTAAKTACGKNPPPERRLPPAIAPATRQHAALPPPPHASRRLRPRWPRRHRPRRPIPMRWKTSSNSCASTSRRTRPRPKRRSSDPVARKLAEWIILRSDDNGASVERYRAFIAANPSWPSQTFLRRRLEAALWDDHRDDATVWSWFENKSPLSAKGKFALARVMLGRGDRANAERLVRDAWRNDAMSEDTENTALDLFGALLTPGDQKARMDLFLYGSEHEAALRAAKRLGSGRGRAGQGAHRVLPQGLQHQGAARCGSARTARRSRLHLQQDPAAPPRREIRRSRPAHARARRRTRAGSTMSTNGGSSGGCCRARCSTSASTAPPI